MKQSLMLLCAAGLIAGARGNSIAQTFPARQPLRISLDIARFRGADDSTAKTLALRGGIATGDMQIPEGPLGHVALDSMGQGQRTTKRWP